MAQLLPSNSNETDLVLWLTALRDLKQRRVKSINESRMTTDDDTGNAVEVERLKRYADSLKTSINYVADAYSRAWQLDCAHNILRHLPQEIRDMIYKELLDLRNPTMNHESNRQNKCVPLESTLHGFNPYHNLLLSVKDYPHYFDKTFMGTDFVTELSQVFHSESRFILQHPGELEGFLSQDRFDTDCQPYKHIRYITVEVSLELLNVKTGNCRSWSSPKFATPLKQHFQAALRGLDRLKRLQKAAPIIRLRIDCRKHDAGPKFAEVLAPLVYELKSKGCIIDIEGRYGHGMPNDQSTATDFNYDIPKKDWDAKIKTNSAFVTDDKDGATKAPRRHLFGHVY